MPDKSRQLDDAALLAVAGRMRKRAYAAYSGFRVGAALRTRSGKIYPGCNVESVTFGLTICAERVALYSALADGETDFDALAVVVTDGIRAVPCGTCRQMLLEFARDVRLVLANEDGGFRHETVDALLPQMTEDNEGRDGSGDSTSSDPEGQP